MQKTTPEVAQVDHNARADDEGIATDVQQPEPIPHVHAKTILLVFAVYCIYFAQIVNIVGSGALAQSIAAVVGGADKVVWLTQPLAITTVVLGPPVSQAADFWGRKWLLVGLTACGVVGSIVVSRANSMSVAIIGIVVGSLSYGAQPLVHAIPSEVLPRRYRPYAQAGVNVSCALAGVFGLLVGGTLTRNGSFAGFRVYWYITAGIYAGSTALCVLLYNPLPRPLQLSLQFREKIGRLDWLGYILIAIGQILFCVGLTWAQNPYPWKSAQVLAPLLIGVSVTASFVVYETVFKKDGLVHHDLFRYHKHWNFPIALLGIFVDGLVFFAGNNYFAFEISILYTSDSFMVGLRYSIAFFVFAASAMIAGIYCSMTKKLRIPLMLALTSFLIFNVCMSTATTSSSNAVWGYPVFLGLGLGACLCTLVTAAQLSTPPELISITSGLMIAMRSLGGTIGLPIYGAIFNGKLSGNIGLRVAAATLPLGLPETSLGPLISALLARDQAALSSIPGITPSAGGAILESFAQSFRYVWVAAACFVVCALVAAFFLIDPVSEFNTHIDAPAEKDQELYGLGNSRENHEHSHTT